MKVLELLQKNASKILADAHAAVSRAHLQSYEKAGADVTQQRLQTLYGCVLRCVDERNLTPMRRHAQVLARERFDAGFDLWEIQTAINVLEESIWRRIIQELPPAEFAEALGLVSTVLGVGKDMLARTYVSLASKTKAPSINVPSLFDGPA